MEKKQCGIDMSPEDEPGHYICDNTNLQFPHHTCGLHHDPDIISCEDMEEMMYIDEQMMRYARG
jgi:hypothetical protein